MPDVTGGERRSVAPATSSSARSEFLPVPDHVADRHGNVWRVVRVTAAWSPAPTTAVSRRCGIKYAEQVFGPLRPVYVFGGPNGLAVESYPASKDTDSRPVNDE